MGSDVKELAEIETAARACAVYPWLPSESDRESFVRGFTLGFMSGRIAGVRDALEVVGKTDE